MPGALLHVVSLSMPRPRLPGVLSRSRAYGGGWSLPGRAELPHTTSAPARVGFGADTTVGAWGHLCHIPHATGLASNASLRLSGIEVTH